MKVYNIVEYIKRDTTFIKDSSTMDLLCVNVQVKSANLPNLGRKFMFYLIDSVYYLRYNSKQMNNVIWKEKCVDVLCTDPPYQVFHTFISVIFCFP